MGPLTVAKQTMADLARVTGLSVPTISRALRDHPDVSEDTRRLVKSRAEELGYRASSTARALRTGRHLTVSFAVPLDLIGWWEPLLRGASRAAIAQGYQVILNPFDRDSDEVRPESLSGFLAGAPSLPVDGYVLVSPSPDWAAAADDTRPIVVIDDIGVHDGVDVWQSDNYGGARSAVEHLVGRGRTRIAALVPEGGIAGLFVEDRLRGYHDVMAEAELEPTVLTSSEGYPSRLLTSDAIDAALSSGVEIDGLFILADFAAPAVYRSLNRAGIGVGRDISVVGFDDDPSSRDLDPPLTTVHQDLAQLGASAVGNLVDLIGGGEERPAPQIHCLPTTLIERHST